jgi:lysophospholipase L1-like esterase
MSSFLRGAAERLTLVALGFLLAVAVLAAVELALRQLEIGGNRSKDPFLGFSNLVPMFELATRSDGTPIYRTVAARGARVPADFLAEKPAGGFRAFVVGGSSAAGTPYGYSGAFSHWLQLRLAAELPGRSVEIVNAAIDAYGSTRVLAIVREIASYEPDLLIVYSGHNEHAEARFYEHLMDLDPRLFRIWTWFASTHIYGVIGGLLPSSFSPEKLEFNDRGNVLEYFGAHEERFKGKQESGREVEYRALHYEHNLREMISTMRAAGARVMLLTLSQNFADWPPGASTHRRDLAESQRRSWNALILEGDRQLDETGDCRLALKPYHQALAIDGAFADLHFKVAGCEERVGNNEAARLHYLLASDLDRALVGAPTSYNEILRRLARDERTLLVDVDELFTSRSPGGLVGDNLFVDPLHPHLLGQQWIAEATAEALREAGVPDDAARWAGTEYRDPDPEILLAADPELRVRERLIRATRFEQACRVVTLGGLRRTPATPPGRAIVSQEGRDVELLIERPGQPPQAVPEARRDPLLGAERWPFRDVLAVRPEACDQRVVFAAPVEAADASHLHTTIGVHPDQWCNDSSVPVTFAIRAVGEGHHRLLYARTLDPHRRHKDRGSFEVEVSLAEFSGQNLELEFVTGCDGRSGESPGAGGWGIPRIEEAAVLGEKNSGRVP